MRYVLYHANCIDGFGAAWVCWRRFGNDDTQYIPVIYNEDPPPMEGATEIWIVDFSYPREVLLKLRERCRVVVIDHHKTAREALEGLEDCVFDMNFSGAVLTWKYFVDKMAPEFLLYIQDRDLWKKELPETEEFFAALVSYPYDFELWTKFAEDIEHLKVEGRAIYRKMKLDIAYLCKRARRIELAGYNILAVNTCMYQSEVGNQLMKDNPDEPFVCCYAHTKEGYLLNSLRTVSDRNINVADIAKQYGGGGHPCAAGFIIKEVDAIWVTS